MWDNFRAVGTSHPPIGEAVTPLPASPTPEFNLLCTTKQAMPKSAGR